MDIPESIKKKIDEDIASLENAILDFRNEHYPENAKLELYQDIVHTYSNIIPKLGDGLYNYYPTMNFFENVSGESLQYNLRALKAKLIAFVDFGLHNTSSGEVNTSPITIHNNPSFLNSNINHMSFNISFEIARKTIEDMPGLTAPETDEILAKIEEIKVIVEAPESKKRKWDKIKPVVKWIADKSVDVGMVLLPLLLKMQQ